MSGCLSSEGSCLCCREKAPQLALCPPPLAVLNGEHLSLSPAKLVSLGKKMEDVPMSESLAPTRPLSIAAGRPPRRPAVASVTLSALSGGQLLKRVWKSCG